MKTILLLILLISATFGRSQDTLSSDTICFNLNDYKKVLRLANKGYFCDTLIQSYENEIETLNQISKTKTQQLELSEKLVLSLSNDLEVTRKKLKWSIFGLGALGILSVIFIIL